MPQDGKLKRLHEENRSLRTELDELKAAVQELAASRKD
jgi:hypothetical protein